jgi:hypothetical protein
MARRKLVSKVTVIKMVLATHVIETDQNFEKSKSVFSKNNKVRKLILLGLAVAMALATVAPIVVLAG